MEDIRGQQSHIHTKQYEPRPMASHQIGAKPRWYRVQRLFTRWTSESVIMVARPSIFEDIKKSMADKNWEFTTHIQPKTPHYITLTVTIDGRSHRGFTHHCETFGNRCSNAEDSWRVLNNPWKNTSEKLHSTMRENERKTGTTIHGRFAQSQSNAMPSFHPYSSIVV